jgi:uncharacterized protein YxjI
VAEALRIRMAGQHDIMLAVTTSDLEPLPHQTKAVHGEQGADTARPAVLRDPAGREVAQVHRKLVAMRPTYQISAGGQEVAEVRKHFFTPFRDRFTIDIPGPDDLEMMGDLFDHEYTICRGDQTVATISKRWFSVRDTYAVDVAPGQDDLLILASVLALDLAEDREREQH